MSEIFITLTAAALAVFAVVAFTDFFDFHGGGAFVHYHDTGHYYLGARYFPELGYTDLYAAMLAAEVESEGTTVVRRARDLASGEMTTAAEVLAHGLEVRERFAPDRWRDFRRDADYFRAVRHVASWRDLRGICYSRPVPLEGSLSADGPEITRFLAAWSQGDREAGERLMQLVYAELRRMASGYLRGERTGHTLQPTALVHEAYLRLLGHEQLEWKSRAQFFGLAATTMRRILIDHARKSRSRKRGGEVAHLPFHEVEPTIWRDSSW